MRLIVETENTDASLITAVIHKLKQFDFNGQKLIWQILDCSSEIYVLHIDLYQMEYFYSSYFPESDYYHLILPEQWDELTAYIQERFEQYLVKSFKN